MIGWRIHHRSETVSTNLDAREGTHGDVYTADFQTAGRGRLDHKWLSAPGENLMMSVVLSVEGLSPEHVATLPLVIGLAVCRGLSPLFRGLSPLLKWPNDVLVGWRKLSGILSERQGDFVIVGIGVNVNQIDFPPEIAEKSTSLAIIANGNGDSPQWKGLERGSVPQVQRGSVPLVQRGSVPRVRDAILAEIGRLYDIWVKNGFGMVYPQIAAIDCLKGRELAVRQTDEDAEPIRGLCGGICPDGSLDVAGHSVYAGEAHVL